MEFTCPSCHIRNIVADEQVRNKTLGVKCVTCGHITHFHQGVPVDDYYGAMQASAQSPYDYSGAGFLSYPPQNSSNSSITQNDWHYSINEQSFGPYSLDILRRMFTSGDLGPEVYVWHEIYDQVGWQLAKDVEFFADIFRSTEKTPLPMGHSMISEAFNTQGLAEITARRASQPRLDVENINALRRKLNANPLGDALRASISSSNPAVTPDSPTVPEAESLNSNSRQPASSKGSSIHNLRATRLAAEKISDELGSSSKKGDASPVTTSSQGSSPQLTESSNDSLPLPEPQTLGPAAEEFGSPLSAGPPASLVQPGSSAAPRSHPGANRRPRPTRAQVEETSQPKVESFAPADLPVEDERPFEPPVASKKSSRGPILLALVVICAGAVLAYFYLSPQKDTPEVPVAESDAPSDGAPAADSAAAPEEGNDTAPSDANANGEEGSEGSGELAVPVPEPEGEPNAGTPETETSSEGEEAAADSADLNGVFQNARFADGSDVKKPRIAPLDAPKVLTQEQALEGIRKVSRGVEVCRERFIRQGGSFDTDKITFSLTVLGTGVVDKVEIKPASLEKGEFARCINSQRSRWTFFATGGPPQRVVRSFVIQ